MARPGATKRLIAHVSLCTWRHELQVGLLALQTFGSHTCFASIQAWWLHQLIFRSEPHKFTGRNIVFQVKPYLRAMVCTSEAMDEAATVLHRPNPSLIDHNINITIVALLAQC